MRKIASSKGVADGESVVAQGKTTMAEGNVAGEVEEAVLCTTPPPTQVVEGIITKANIIIVAKEDLRVSIV